MLKTRGFLTVISAMAIFWQPVVATAEQPNRAAVVGVASEHTSAIARRW